MFYFFFGAQGSRLFDDVMREFGCIKFIILIADHKSSLVFPVYFLLLLQLGIL